MAKSRSTRPTGAMEFSPEPRDPAVMALPHPRRLDLMNYLQFYQQQAFWPLWQRLLADPELALDEMREILVEDPASLPYLSVLGATLIGTGSDAGAFAATLAYLRLKIRHGRLFQTRDRLDQMLRHTDVIGAGTPCRYLMLPYRSVYLEFGERRSTPYYLVHPESGRHVLEGVYAHEAIFRVQPDSHMPERYRGVLEAGRSYRVIDLLFTGSPVGKTDYTDDVTFNLSLYIGSDEETIETVLERALLANRQDKLLAGQLLRDAERNNLREKLAHVVKVLLYLNSTTVRTAPVTGEAELKKRIAGTPAVLRKKLIRKLETTYDRIVIGPEAAVTEATATSVTAGREMSAHWRRGHFRHQACGEQFSQRKVIWIEPVLVRADRIGEQSPPGKNYVVR